MANASGRTYSLLFQRPLKFARRPSLQVTIQCAPCPLLHFSRRSTSKRAAPRPTALNVGGRLHIHFRRRSILGARMNSDPWISIRDSSSGDIQSLANVRVSLAAVDGSRRTVSGKSFVESVLYTERVADCTTPSCEQKKQEGATLSAIRTELSLHHHRCAKATAQIRAPSILATAGAQNIRLPIVLTLCTLSAMYSLSGKNYVCSVVKDLLAQPARPHRWTLTLLLCRVTG